MRIEVLGDADEPGALAAVQRLVGQLSSSAAPPSADRLRELVGSDAVTLFVARDHAGEIVGMLALAVFPVATGLRAWIEDVVVDESRRGAGVGAALVGRAVDHARSLGARTVDLTSRPAREPANRLYRELGFVERATNVYRYEIR